MVSEQGIVEKITGRKAVIRIERTSACATCESRGHCEVGSTRKMVVEVPNELGAQNGDRVEVSIPTGSFLKLTLLVYLFPIVALIAGAYAGEQWAGFVGMNPTVASIIGGGLSTAIAFIALRALDRRFRMRGQTGPRMTRILLRSGL
ncbi:MAG: SoxR reducing system RseC family protein [Desulfobacteraceae bacterium]